MNGIDWTEVEYYKNKFAKRGITESELISSLRFIGLTQRQIDDEVESAKFRRDER